MLGSKNGGCSRGGCAVYRPDDDDGATLAAVDVTPDVAEMLAVPVITRFVMLLLLSLPSINQPLMMTQCRNAYVRRAYQYLSFLLLVLAIRTRSCFT